MLVLVGTRLALLWVLGLHPRLFVRLRQGFEYKMRFVYAHFPINVAITGAKNKIEIRNFLGEKIVRTVDAYPGVTATRSADIKDEIVVVGNDIDNVSKTWYATARTACCDGHASGRTGPQGGPTSSPAARGARPLAAPHRMRHRILSPSSPHLAPRREAPRSPAACRDAPWQCSGPADLRGEAQGHPQVPRRHLRVREGQRRQGLSLYCPTL